MNDMGTKEQLPKKALYCAIVMVLRKLRGSFFIPKSCLYNIVNIVYNILCVCNIRIYTHDCI